MAVNIADRLQSLAKEDEILISERTFQKLSGDIETEVLPPITVKGLNEPIKAFRVTG